MLVSDVRHSRNMSLNTPFLWWEIHNRKKRAIVKLNILAKTNKTVHLCINHTTIFLSVIIKYLQEPDKW
jgi:hypothetical protein